MRFTTDIKEVRETFCSTAKLPFYEFPTSFSRPKIGASCTVLQRLTWLVEKTKERKNRTMLPALKNNAAAGYQGPVKIKLLKGAGLLQN